MPLATLAAPAPAPFMDVSNVILESPSPTKPPPGLKLPASPVRRAATPAEAGQENPAVVNVA